MRTISNDLKTHIQQQVTTLCICWKIVRQDSTKLAFTSHTSSFAYDDGSGDGSLTYKPTTGISPTNTKESVGTGVDNMEVLGILNSPDILDSDLMSGKYDRAKITVMFLNYKDLTMGHCVLIKGTIGQVSIKAGSFQAEVRSLNQALGQQVGRVCTPTCMADFGDAECNVNGGNMAPFTYTGVVTFVSDQRIFWVGSFSGLTANILSFGKCTFNDGNNEGLVMDIKYNDNVTHNGRIELQEQMPFAIQVGDEVTVVQGCDRRLVSCISYSNVANFRGFPYLPGTDNVLKIVKG